MPLGGIVLGAEYGECHLISGLYQLQHVLRLRRLEWVEQSCVQNKQLLFLEPFHVVSVDAVGPGPEISSSRSGQGRRPGRSRQPQWPQDNDIMALEKISA